MVSDSQATVRTCSDHNDSSVLTIGATRFTLLLPTVITKVFVEFIIEPAQLYVISWWSNQKKTQKVAELYSRTSNIYIFLAADIVIITNSN